MSPERKRYNDGWGFMENPHLNHLQQALDASLTDYSGIDELREKAEEFSLELMECLDEILSKPNVSRATLEQVVEFMRRNMTILDSGGLSAGRSEQDEALSFANQMLIEQIGEDRYFALVVQYEENERVRRHQG